MSCLKSITTSGGVLSSTIRIELLERFPNVKYVREAYGLNECGLVTLTYPREKKNSVSTAKALETPNDHVMPVGLPNMYTQIKIISRQSNENVGGPDEQGEICIKSPQTFIGYLNEDNKHVSGSDFWTLLPHLFRKYDQGQGIIDEQSFWSLHHPSSLGADLISKLLLKRAVGRSQGFWVQNYSLKTSSLPPSYVRIYWPMVQHKSALTLPRLPAPSYQLEGFVPILSRVGQIQTNNGPSLWTWHPAFVLISFLAPSSHFSSFLTPMASFTPAT